MSDRAPRFHLSLHVQAVQLDALVAFYSQVFGIPPRKHYADYVQFDLADPPLNLTLTPRASGTRGEIDHLGIQVFSQAALDAARHRLSASGLALREEPEVDCCYARQNKFWATDPEGREVEVFLTLADLERHGRAAPTAASGTTTCCAAGSCG